ncbi:hypothetical protein AB0M45_28820 [Nocardia sp. NPDC051787]|uniref:hypothetical protein n=1 Tax=Nocardia sp. NPDC051787 TaxID=3155415 RepID=UPI00342A953C
MAETEDHLRNFPEHANELANRRLGYLLSRYVEKSMIEMERNGAGAQATTGRPTHQRQPDPDHP